MCGRRTADPLHRHARRHCFDVFNEGGQSRCRTASTNSQTEHLLELDLYLKTWRHTMQLNVYSNGPGPGRSDRETFPGRVYRRGWQSHWATLRMDVGLRARRWSESSGGTPRSPGPGRRPAHHGIASGRQSTLPVRERRTRLSSMSYRRLSVNGICWSSEYSTLFDHSQERRKSFFH